MLEGKIRIRMIATCQLCETEHRMPDWYLYKSEIIEKAWKDIGWELKDNGLFICPGCANKIKKS